MQHCGLCIWCSSHPLIELLREEVGRWGVPWGVVIIHGLEVGSLEVLDLFLALIGSLVDTQCHQPLQDSCVQVVIYMLLLKSWLLFSSHHRFIRIWLCSSG